jgi:predicted amidohydrolase
MKIALIQMRCELGDVSANLAEIGRSVAAAGAAGADVVVFPEMADTGYEMQTILRTAGPVDGAARAAVAASAARHGVWVIAGLSLREGERVFNTAVVFDRAGVVRAEYRKMHLFSGQPVCEDRHLSAGERAVTFDLDGQFAAGLMICYDVRFPELARCLVIEGGAGLLLCPTAWPGARIGHWQTLTAARAIENLAYFVGVNRAGADAGLPFGGASVAVAPWGERLAMGDVFASAEGAGAAPGILTCELDVSRLTESRRNSGVLRDRRPKLYGQNVNP